MVTGINGIGALILWYFSALAIDQSVVPDNLLGLLDYIFKFVSVMIAALTGAYCAFRFNASLEEKRREFKKHQQVNKLMFEKMEEVIFKLHKYSLLFKNHYLSYAKQNGGTINDPQFSYEAQELSYEIEVYVKLYFPEMPFDAMNINAEAIRYAGECDKVWMNLADESYTEIGAAHRCIGWEVNNLDKLLKPFFDWCLSRAENYKISGE